MARLTSGEASRALSASVQASARAKAPMPSAERRALQAVGRVAPGVAQSGGIEGRQHRARLVGKQRENLTHHGLVAGDIVFEMGEIDGTGPSGADHA
jgi:hypothetical protein